MTVERTVQGAWRVSQIVDGYLLTRQFFGYTKKEAMQLFKQYTKEGVR